VVSVVVELALPVSLELPVGLGLLVALEMLMGLKLVLAHLEGAVLELECVSACRHL
jgi:hypothetical protein